MIVLDASAALAALLGAGVARTTLTGDQVHLPHLADAEVAQTLRRLDLAGQLESAAATACLTTWSHLALVRHPLHPLLGRIWELRQTITAYDASYVALAEALGCALVTADGRLARASGPRCPITVVPG